MAELGWKPPFSDSIPDSACHGELGIQGIYHVVCSVSWGQFCKPQLWGIPSCFASHWVLEGVWV